MGIGLGLVAIVLAALITWKQIGPDWLAERVAALLALVGVQSAVASTAVGDWVRGVVGDGVGLLADAAGKLDGAYSAAVRTWTVPLVVLAVGTIWLAAMLTSRASRYVGGIANEGYSSGLIWGGALVLALFATALPGAWGDLVGSGVDALARFGQGLVTGAVA